MRIHYPSSFLKLLLIGFAFAILPLLWAFANANIAFDKLAKQSQLTISNAVETTRASRVLQEQLHLMERSIRQYFVLQDDVLFNNYKQANMQFNAAISQLSQLANNATQKQNLHVLSLQSSLLNQSILNAKQSKNTELNFLDNFSKLTQLADISINENNHAIEVASAQLTLAAKHMQKQIFLQSLILIPLALLVAGIITYMLARPIRRMDAAIKHLGNSEYNEPITIDGPGDLRILGRRLDWLRIELKELNQQKQRFLQHVSHELKTPLTAIREATELLHDGIGGTLTSQQNEITHILRNNGIKLQKMIENLLYYNKIEFLQPKLCLEKVSLSSVIDKVIDAHALTIRNKKLTIESVYHVNEIIADEEKITLIIDNLISNAVKYTPTLGNIKIKTTQEKNWFIVEVIDDGPGLAKTDRDKLFDPFYRGDTPHKDLISSSGLGLTIAKELAEAHSGVIELATAAKGAHFIVRIPVLELI
jgi:two-component system, NtrC family, sensor histidine kinase GlrK